MKLHEKFVSSKTESMSEFSTVGREKGFASGKKGFGSANSGNNRDGTTVSAVSSISGSNAEIVTTDSKTVWTSFPLEQSCPCHSKQSYASCCFDVYSQSQHTHLPFAPSLDSSVAVDQNKKLERFVRSRYTAYALQHPEYLIQTTHPMNYVSNSLSGKLLFALFIFQMTL
jgi:hypothetical protein